MLQLASAKEIGGMPDVAETESSFVGNARLKAEALYAQAPEGSWVLADDSGLQVDALEGAPGVYSARFAGVGASAQACIDLLLEKLEGVEQAKRSAQFVCTLVLLGPGKQEQVFEGIAPGHITLGNQGESSFGYDPVFIPEGHQETYAQMGADLKNTMSHRTRALNKLARFFRGL